MGPIRIISPALDLLGEVDNYLSLSFSRSYHSPGEFQLVTNWKVQNAGQLDINNLIMLGADPLNAGIIRHKELKTSERGEEILTIKGFSLGTILRQRITIPPVGESHDIQEANAETVMKHYVRRNCLDVDGMEFPFLVIAENQNRGENIKWQTRYKNLCDELEQMSLLTGLGWHIYPDFSSRMWVFDVFNGRNFTAGQNIKPPVIFSPEFDNIKSQEYVDSIINYATYAIVAGQDEGADREIAMLGSDATGLDRHVIFVDARDVQDVDDLPARGEVKLAEHQRVISFQAEVLPAGPFTYQQDWDVGDIVTIQNKNWNLTMDSRITAVEEIYEPGGLKLNVSFGNSLPTLSQKLKAALGQFKTESTR